MDLILANLPYLMNGLGVTVGLAVCLLLLGFVIGLGLAIAQVYGGFGVPFCATMFERLFRAVPAVVLLFLFYFGISTFYDISSFSAAVLALGIRSGSYQSQIFRGSIQSVPPGQLVAARALGVTLITGVLSVVLPQALRQAIGPWSNEALAELKDTSLAYTIGVVELMSQANFIITSSYGHVLLVLSAAALAYLLLSIALTVALAGLRHKLALPGFEQA